MVVRPAARKSDEIIQVTALLERKKAGHVVNGNVGLRNGHNGPHLGSSPQLEALNVTAIRRYH